MKKNNKGSARAKQLLAEIGFEDLSQTSLEMLCAFLGIYLIEAAMENADGRIVRGKQSTLIKINADIPYPERKRFALAHEIGHFLLHNKLEFHGDTAHNLNWFQRIEHQAQKGIQEYEANDFASELLMPETVFRKACVGQVFSPDLIQQLSKKFQTSLTSVIFRLFHLNLYPILIVSVSYGKVRYWLKTEDFKARVKDLNKLSPPEDSIAAEYIEANYAYLYTGDQKKQEIEKSVWFELGHYEKDRPMYEYCIPIRQYQHILSVIWED